MNRFISSKSWLWLILLLALVLRLVVINQSLWLDEAIGALVVREQTFKQIATQFPKSDNHPPLYYLVLKGWTNIFGYSELSLRLPSVIFGILTVLLTYFIAIELIRRKNWKLPEVAALLIATSPFHIYYSQEARMYVMAGFFAALAIYCFLLLIKHSGTGRLGIFQWILFSFSITLLVFTDYVPVFLIPVFWVYAIYKGLDRSWWKKFLLAHVPLIMFGLLWFPILLHQLERGRWLVSTLPAWKEIAGGATFKQAALVWMKFVLGRISFADKGFYYSLVLVFSVPFALALFRSWKSKKDNLIIWLWLALPLFLTFCFSFLFPAFIYFRFVYVIPAFYILISFGILSFKSHRLKLILATLILGVNLLGWFAYVSEAYQQREQWRQAVSFIESKAKGGDIVIFENSEPFAPYRWYQKNIIPAVGGTDSISANENETLAKTKSWVSGKKGIYYFEYLNDLHDPEGFVRKVISDEGFIVSKIYDFFPGIGQISYYIRKD